MTLVERKILKKALNVIDEMKGEETLTLDLRKLTTMTDYFVITSATNTRQVAAMAKRIEEQIDEWYGVKPLHSEGMKNSMWVLMDYGFFILHIFLDEKRRIYNLEKIWMDAPRISVK